MHSVDHSAHLPPPSTDRWRLGGSLVALTALVLGIIAMTAALTAHFFGANSLITASTALTGQSVIVASLFLAIALLKRKKTVSNPVVTETEEEKTRPIFLQIIYKLRQSQQMESTYDLQTREHKVQQQKHAIHEVFRLHDSLTPDEQKKFSDYLRKHHSQRAGSSQSLAEYFNTVRRTKRLSRSVQNIDFSEKSYKESGQE